nr:LOB domain-containing protein 36-like [Ipomoea batatas]
MSSSSTPCAACKLQRRKCTQECVFAPYFPPDQPQKFANVHKVFGASNVAKLLNELHTSQREDAVNSLAYEAECRLRDPVYGCVGLISILQQKLKQVQHDLLSSKRELANYIGPAAMQPLVQHPGFLQHPNNPSNYLMGLPTVVPHAAAQLIAHDSLQQQQQQPFIEPYHQLAGVMSSAASMPPYDTPYAMQQPGQEHFDPNHDQIQLQSQPPMQQQQQQPPQPQERPKSEEGRSVDPSC